MAPPATTPRMLQLLRALLIALSLILVATACAGGDDTSGADDDQDADEAAEEAEDEESEEAEEDPVEEDPAPTEEAAEPTEEPADDDDAAPAAGGDDTAGVVAARDAALAALPADWTTTAQEPEQGPDGIEGEEDDPLNACLPDGLQNLESQVDALQTVSASGDFTAPATGEEAFGPASGSVTVNAYSDPEAAQDLLRQFGEAVADPAFSECVIDATSEEFGAPPEGSEFDVQVLPGVDGIDSEVALQILVSASFGGQSVNFDAVFVLASRGDYIVEGQFTGDGENPFPIDIAAAVVDAAA